MVSSGLVIGSSANLSHLVESVVGGGCADFLQLLSWQDAATSQFHA